MHGSEGWVEIEQVVVFGINDRHAEAARAEEAMPLFHLPLSLAAFADIAEHQHRAHRFAVDGADGGSAVGNRDRLALFWQQHCRPG